MLEKLNSHSDTMALAIVLWLCSLPLIALLVLPLFGPTVALSTALTLLVVFLVLCWVFCLRHVVDEHIKDS
jgi:uncharacterized membrane protein YqjE